MLEQDTLCCRKCGENKSPDEFYRRKGRTGRRSECKACGRAELDAIPNTPEAARARWLRRRFGMNIADWDALYEAQGQGCAICGIPENRDGRSLAVDHDHSTGAVRGLLCTACNQALGCFADDPARLQRAIDYLCLFPAGRARLTIISS